jgi:hypothetical protein
MMYIFFFAGSSSPGQVSGVEYHTRYVQMTIMMGLPIKTVHTSISNDEKNYPANLSDALTIATSQD